MTDPCVLRLIREGKVVLILTVHVNDMAVAGTWVEFDKLLVTLNTDFTTNNLGELSFFTGWSIIQESENGELNSTKRRLSRPSQDVLTCPRLPVLPPLPVRT